MGFLAWAMGFVYIIVCAALILVILIQRGEGGGLGGAFGGAGAGEAFGAKADTSFKKVTAVLAAIFMALSIYLGYLQSPNRGSGLDDQKPKPDPTAPEGPGAAVNPPADDAGDEPK